MTTIQIYRRVPERGVRRGCESGRRNARRLRCPEMPSYAAVSRALRRPAYFVLDLLLESA